MVNSDDEYEFVSKESLSKLHNEVKNLKDGGMKDLVTKDKDLHKSIKSLTGALNTLVDVFHDAALEMKLEDTETNTLKDKISPLESKLDILIEQNKKIAQGLVAITDAIQTKFDEIETRLDGHPNEHESAHMEPDLHHEDGLSSMPQAPNSDYNNQFNETFGSYSKNVSDTNGMPPPPLPEDEQQ